MAWDNKDGSTNYGMWTVVITFLKVDVNPNCITLAFESTVYHKLSFITKICLFSPFYILCCLSVLIAIFLCACMLSNYGCRAFFRAGFLLITTVSAYAFWNFHKTPSKAHVTTQDHILEAGSDHCHPIEGSALTSIWITKYDLKL